ncbi:MAG: 16S rRNA (uracil(1498)-N(3))-methyltransferase [Firmicutes bacterium]|nr:16S rRNA (uracil(1498)-N(3))-methyltransferase [Bacillota bacterium]
MQRYFIEDSQVTDGFIQVRGSDVHHMKNVMRFRIGEVAVFISKSGMIYEAEHLSFQKDEAQFRILSKTISTKKTSRITIAQALIKKDRFELFLEKSTELGVYEIIPTLFSRSIIKLDEKEESKKLLRYQNIVKEASEQSERDHLPLIKEVTKLKNIPFENYDKILVCYERVGELNLLKNHLPNLKPEDQILVLIGPEGGIAQEELDFMISKGGQVVSLGSQILRSETASLVILSALMIEWGL